MAAPSGSRNGNTDLTEDDVRLIRALIRERDMHRAEAAKLSLPRIAEKFDLKPIAVHRIAHYATWLHVRD